MIVTSVLCVGNSDKLVYWRLLSLFNVLVIVRKLFLVNQIFQESDAYIYIVISGIMLYLYFLLFYFMLLFFLYYLGNLYKEIKIYVKFEVCFLLIMIGIQYEDQQNDKNFKCMKYKYEGL